MTLRITVERDPMTLGRTDLLREVVLLLREIRDQLNTSAGAINMRAAPLSRETLFAEMERRGLCPRSEPPSADVPHPAPPDTDPSLST